MAPQDFQLLFVQLEHKIFRESNSIKQFVLRAKAQANRSKVIFATSGLYGIGKKVKKYFKAILGYGSEAYQPIRKIRFVTR